MHSNNQNSAFGRHHSRERFGAADNSFSALPSILQNRILRLDGRGVDDQFGVSRIFRAVFAMKFQSETLQALRLLGIEFVRAAHLMSKLKEQSGDAAHTASRYPDQMNAMAFGSQEFGEVLLRRNPRLDRSSGR